MSAALVRGSRRALAVAFALGACLSLASTAHASRVGVGAIRGAGGASVRDALEDSLRRSGHEVPDRAEVEAAGAIPAPAAIGADFVLGGRVRRAGSAWIADLNVTRADARGARRVRMRASDPEGLADRVVEYLESRVRGFEPDEAPSPQPVAVARPEPVADVAPAPEPSQAAVPEAPAREAATRDEPRERYRLAGASARAPGDPLGFRQRNVLDLETSFGVLTRSLSYRDDLFTKARGYDLGAAGTLVLRARLFPFARTSIGGVRDLGIETESEYALVADSRRPDGQVYPTSASAWTLALAYRHPFGRHSVLGTLGYGVHSFLIDPAGPASPTNDPRPELPRVRYQTLRAGLGLRLAPIAGLVLHLRGTYLHVLDAGGITSDVWFPHARVTAIEGMAGVGYRLHPALELRAAVQYRRYGMDLQPEPGDPFIVGGAADQYWLYTIGLAVSR